jgi:lipopolysaccharide export system protein LptA
MAAVAGLTLVDAASVAAAPARTPPPIDAECRPTDTARDQPATVDSATMERFGKSNVVVFSGNVVAQKSGSVQFADRIEIYLDEREGRVVRTVSTGNVRIVTRDCRHGSARRMEYDDLEQRVMLRGDARVWREGDVVDGDTILIDLSRDWAVAERGRLKPVRAVLSSRGRAPATPTGALLAGAAAVGQPSTADKTPRPGENQSDPVSVDSDRMERFGKESLVIFTGNVVARQDSSVQYADRMEVYLDEKGDRILRTVSTGNVRIVTKDCRTGTARRAEYHDLEQRVVLSGNARVWQEDNVVSGESIVIYLSQDRSVVEGGTQERVKAVFYPRDAKKDGANTGAAKKPAAPCAN